MATRVRERGGNGLQDDFSERVLVWYAAFSEHCSLFPTNAVTEAFREELKNYTISKGTIQFPVDKPLSATLVRKMVKMRLTQISSAE